MIHADRLRRTFLDLTAINSPPGNERECARYCYDALSEIGFVCQWDPAGNVIAQRAGQIPGKPRIFFSAHTDTVQPTPGLVVREDDGVFRTGGTTILGADDKAALAQIIEACRILDEASIPHGDLQVILTTGEEVGLLGAKALAPEVIAGSLGFVFDASGQTGAIITAAPTHDKLRVRFTGRAAHAGFAPEKGASAIGMAARAIDRMPLGRIDPETTANIGTIRGGVADNVVAEEAFLTMEARSRNPEALERQIAAMRAALEEAAAHFDGAVHIEEQRDYRGYAHSDDSPLLRIAAAAWRRTPTASGDPPELRPTGGGSDANVYNAIGVPTVVLSCGYRDAHTVDEHIHLRDLIAGAEWAVEIARVAAA